MIRATILIPVFLAARLTAADLAGPVDFAEMTVDTPPPSDGQPLTVTWAEGLHRVVVVEGGSPFSGGDGTKALLVADEDNTSKPFSPSVLLYFPPTTAAISIGFDVMIPDGADSHHPVVLLGDDSKGTQRNLVLPMTLRNRGDGSLLIGSGSDRQVLPALTPGIWHRVVIQTTAIITGETPTADIAITPWDPVRRRPGVSVLAQAIPVRLLPPDGGEPALLERYGRVMFQQWVHGTVDDAQADTRYRGRFMLDNLVVRTR